MNDINFNFIKSLYFYFSFVIFVVTYLLIYLFVGLTVDWWITMDLLFMADMLSGLVT